MNRFIIAIIFIISITSLTFGEEEARVFTNEDLYKYGEKSTTRQPSQAPAEQAENEPDNELPVKKEEKKLKRHIVPYKVSEGTEMRIIIPVTFNYGVRANLLLDTGATGMYISTDLAERIGVFENSEAKLIWAAGGIGGTVPAVITVIDSIKIGDMTYEFIPTTISDSNFRNFEGLVGMDFMTNYSVHIDSQNHIVEFEELPESSEMPAGRTEAWWKVTFRNFRTMKETWEKYRRNIHEDRSYSGMMKELKEMADQQYYKADELLTRLEVYASTHSVPLEWR